MPSGNKLEEFSSWAVLGLEVTPVKSLYLSESKAFIKSDSRENVQFS